MIFLRRKITVFVVISLFMGTAILISMNGSGIAAKNYVDAGTAAEVAEAKIFQLGKFADFSICGESTVYDNGGALFHVLYLKPRGYVVVSADFSLPPVIAYSFTSNFSVGKSALTDILRADIALRMKNIHNLPYRVIEDRKLMWKGMLNGNAATANFEQWPP